MKTSSMARTFVLAASLLATIASARTTLAATTHPFPGITHVIDDAGGGPYHAVTIDLTAYRLVQTKPGTFGQAAADFAASTGSVVVMNSNFAAGSGGPSCGLEMGYGVAAQDSYLDSDTNNCRDSIGFRFGDGACDSFDSFSIVKGPAPAMFTDVFTGMPFMVRGGVKNTATIPKFGSTLAPRTVLGISKDKKTAYLVVTQGRNVPAGAIGYATNGAIVDTMANLGAWDAVNLDGGGSSLMWIGAEGGIQNSPTDGHERIVCCHLGVVPAPPPPDAGPVVPPLDDAGAGDDAGSFVDAGGAAPPLDDAPPPGDSSTGCACKVHVTRQGGSALFLVAPFLVLAVRRLQRRRAR